MAAIAIGQDLYDARMVIDDFRGAAPQAPTRYLDSSLQNIGLHVTFLFGLLPSHAYRTPLPDWSIGLEMQFYAVLPMIMVLIGKVGWLRGLGIVVGGAAILNVALAKEGVFYPMPAFLPLKLHVFAAGMLLASALTMERSRAVLVCGCASLLVLIPFGGHNTPMHSIVRVAVVLIFFVLVHGYRWHGALGFATGAVNRVLGGRFCHYLGELSFGAYLIHLLVMQPVVAWLIINSTMTSVELWFWALVLTTPLVYALAFLGYRFLELPGQALGKRIAGPRKQVPTAS